MSLKLIDYAGIALDSLGKGAFLTTKVGNEVNTMTIAWGSLGIMWGKDTITIVVRPSRHTYELIEKSTHFTVSLPQTPAMKEALAICGTKSGRDINKFDAAKISLLPGQSSDIPVIKGAGLHIEAKILYRQKMDTAALPEEIRNLKYASGDYHVFYIAEILAAYQED